MGCISGVSRVVMAVLGGSAEQLDGARRPSVKLPMSIPRPANGFDIRWPRYKRKQSGQVPPSNISSSFFCPPLSRLPPKCRPPFIFPSLSSEPSSSVSFHLSPSPGVANFTSLSSGASNGLAFIVLALSAYTLSQTAVAVNFYFTYSALGVATAVIHLCTVTPM